MNYKQVMKRAVETKIALAPSEFLEWRHSEKLAVYYAEHGAHVIDPEFGNLITLNDGAAIIEGAPTIDAAMQAATLALKLGLV
jgi:hypothetical protein